MDLDTTQQKQTYLQFGAADHIQLLHHGHNAYIPLALMHNNQWHQTNLPKGQAVQSAGFYACDDSYVGQQPVRGIQAGRSVQNLSALTSFYSDLDFYKQGYTGDIFSILNELSQLDATLPSPTFAADSGRGGYFVWVLHETKPAQFLPHWQFIQDQIHTLLKPYGADPQAKDAVRVLRVAQSTNTKAQKAVEYYQVGDTVKYEKVQAWANKHWNRHKSARSKKTAKKGTVTALPTKNGYTLAFGRMRDIEKLAELRGGRFSDCRKRTIFYFAVAASWFCNDVETLKASVESFVRQFISDPDSYLKDLPKAVYKRKKMAMEGITIEWNGKEWDARYRPRNSTIIEALEITVDEQAKLATIISREVKDERWLKKLTVKRREKGVVERDEYEGKAQDRKQQALKLREQGLSQRAIAKELGVSRGAVEAYLRGVA